MSSTATCIDNFGSGFKYIISQGVSEAANCLKNKNNEIKNLNFNSALETGASRVNAISKALEELFLECKIEDWDSRGANAIPRQAVEDAKLVIELLPTDYPMPEIFPEVTGEVGLEWYVNPYRVLVLSLPGDGYIYYSGLYGYKITDYGSKLFAGQIDKKIISLLEEIYQ